MKLLRQAIQELQYIRGLKDKRKLASEFFFILEASQILGFLCLFAYFFILPLIIQRIWSSVIAKYTNVQIYVSSMMVLNIVFNGGFLFVLGAFQYFKADWLQQLKITNKPWPWVQNQKAWRQLFVNSLKTSVINTLAISTILMFITIQKPLPYDFTQKNYPNPIQICLQISFFMLVQDCLFYFSHRLLHHPSFYWIHKKHHEYTQTVAIAAQYSHPLEHLLSGIIPTVSGVLLLTIFLPVHFVTVFIWILYRTIQGCCAHSGYDFGFQHGNLLPFAIGADHHDFHHALNSGNYGSLFMFWDALFGTQRDYVKWLQKKHGKEEMGNENKDK